MMVVHEDNEKPVEVAVIKKPLLEQKSYVIVKNHVRELANTAQNNSNLNTDENTSLRSSSNKDTKKKKRTSNKTLNKTEEMPVSLESNNIDNSTTEIDTSDLNELKTVYMKCREVMKKIETKYGHLLNLDIEPGTSECNKRKWHSETLEDECYCKSNKKIIFDDDGTQFTSEKCTCMKIIKSTHSERQTRSKHIEIEYKDVDIVIPDNLQELGEMLRDPTTERTCRNQVLNKMRLLKQEYANDIRFNRHILIEKLKSNPDEVLDFKGSNLSTIPGYS